MWRENVLAAAASQDLDEFYSYDGLDRLFWMRRGDLNGTKTGIEEVDTNHFSVTALDALGNWVVHAYGSNGSSLDLSQVRTHNTVNELTRFATYIGTDWIDPVHDDAGNMTTIPQPASPANGFTAVYNAWNRLVELWDEEEEDLVALYEYDGLNQRIVKTGGGEGGTVRHFYYNDRWQCLEERTEDPTQGPGVIRGYADRRYVWGVRYVDELILRQRDTDNDGTLDETLYALQDANFNIVALAEPDGNIVERFIYDAYGKATPLNPNFTAYTGSDLKWEFLYTGRRLDLESGLMYYRNRYYSTGLGRFVNRDPIGYRGGLNLYGYVGSMPTRYVDPFGLDKDKDTVRVRWKELVFYDDHDPVGHYETVTYEITIDYTKSCGDDGKTATIKINSITGNCLGRLDYFGMFGLGAGYDFETLSDVAKAVPCPKGQTGTIVEREIEFRVYSYFEIPTAMPSWPWDVGSIRVKVTKGTVKWKQRKGCCCDSKSEEDN